MATILAGASITADEVKEIYDTEMTNAQLANFINMSYLLVSRLSITDADLEKNMELLLAAHFATTYDGVVKSQSVGSEWSVTYATVIGEGLKSSIYGQQALALDTTGQLAKLELKRAVFKVSSAYDFFGSDYLTTKVVS